jgi:hypothetical protein
MEFDQKMAEMRMQMEHAQAEHARKMTMPVGMEGAA